MSGFPAECVDLVYLDPPFFSNRIYEVIWGDEAEHSGRIVDTTIKRLRRKIASAGCAIKTVRGVGYKLVSSADDE